MHPELFHINLFGFEQKIYTYAFLIVLGTLVASLFTRWRAKKELGIQNLSNNFFYIIFIAGFIGGKLFFYLENPGYYLKNPEFLLNNFSGGFVFYGSFICIIPVVIWYLKKNKIPVYPMLDILAITTLIVHSIGRLGCFFGGCCYGKPTNSFVGMIFPKTHGTHVHPSQLYEIIALLTIIFILLKVKKKQLFTVQIFFTYLILYAFSRFFLEFFRGDQRGFIIEGLLSHSQFISLVFFSTSLILYKKIKTHLLKQIHYENK